MIGTNLAITTKNYAVAGGAVAYDADAVAFFTSASITDTTQKNAVNQLVLDLKAANIWTKMKALYPVVGGVASAHAVNLKTPGTYNLTFQTGWTHASTGMTPNGATYANTSLTPSIILTLNSTHISYYSRTSANGSYDMGSQIVGAGLTLGIRDAGSTYIRVNTYGAGTESNILNADGKGFYQANRNSPNIQSIIKNNTINNFSVNSLGLPNVNIWLGAINNPVIYYGNKQCAFASIGDGLTDAEASSLYTAVQTYQTTLNRQIP